MNRWARRLTGVTVGLSLVCGLTALGTSTPAVGTPQAPEASRASAARASKAPKVSKVSKKVTKTDKVKTPKLRWYRCFDGPYCATVKVPRDYDKPKGAKVELALLKVKARDPKRRIGSLFVNPGGPGGSGTEFAYYADSIFSAAVLDRFDIVGMDPRGLGFSDNVQCFANQGKQDQALKGLSVPFPMRKAEYGPYAKSLRALGKACSKTKGLARAMSTAQVARDMEMMRRAVKDKKLTFYGASYGSYLGEVYASMYPSRFRALAIDGVVNPRAQAGTTKKSRSLPQELRLHAGRGAYRAYLQSLTLCDQVGAVRCPLARGGARVKAQSVASRLRRSSVVIRSEDEVYTYTYADFVSELLDALYYTEAPDYIAYLVQNTWELYYPPETTDDRRADLIRQHKAIRAKVRAVGQRLLKGFPYDNSADNFTVISCTDSRETTKLKNYPKFAEAVDRTGPLFGRLWMWNTAQCAGDVYKAKDEDAYRGPFNRRTKATVLVVGSYWDPATNYDDAKSTAGLLKNARLLQSNTFGHVSYGTSTCVTSAIDNYLLTGKTRASYAACRTDYVPFTPPEDDDDGDGEDDQVNARARLLAQIARGDVQERLSFPK